MDRVVDERRICGIDGDRGVPICTCRWKISSK